ncbi:MAG: hypothetical protein R3E53_08815 [Myxococcota bacterium]
MTESAHVHGRLPLVKAGDGEDVTKEASSVARASAPRSRARPTTSPSTTTPIALARRYLGYSREYAGGPLPRFENGDTGPRRLATLVETSRLDDRKLHDVHDVIDQVDRNSFFEVLGYGRDRRSSLKVLGGRATGIVATTWRAMPKSTPRQQPSRR